MSRRIWTGTAALLLFASACGGGGGGGSGGGGGVGGGPRFVYVANNFDEDILGYAANDAGALTAVPGSPAPSPGAPLGLAVDPSNRFLYAANELSGDVSAYAIDPTTGALTALLASPFLDAGVGTLGAHAVTAESSGRFLFVANADDDSVSVFSIDAVDGSLSAIVGSPFPTDDGPRAVAADPTGRFLYVSNNGDDTVTGYTIDASTGALTEFTDSSPADTDGPRGLAVDPLGAYLYVAETGTSSLEVRTLNTTTGEFGIPIAGRPGAVTPFAVAAAPTGGFVYFTDDANGTISGERNDAGTFTTITGSPFVAGANPRGIAMDAAGRFVYVANRGDGNVSVFSVTPTTGLLVEVAGSPFATTFGPGPSAILVVEP